MSSTSDDIASPTVINAGAAGGLDVVTDADELVSSFLPSILNMNNIDDVDVGVLPEIAPQHFDCGCKTNADVVATKSIARQITRRIMMILSSRIADHLRYFNFMFVVTRDAYFVLDEEEIQFKYRKMNPDVIAQGNPLFNNSNILYKRKAEIIVFHNTFLSKLFVVQARRIRYSTCSTRTVLCIVLYSTPYYSTVLQYDNQKAQVLFR